MFLMFVPCKNESRVHLVVDHKSFFVAKIKELILTYPWSLSVSYLDVLFFIAVMGPLCVLLNRMKWKAVGTF